MRVTLATTAQHDGGVWRHVLDLAAALQQLGHEVGVAGMPGAARPKRQVEARRLRWCGIVASLTTPSDVYHLHLHDTYDASVPALLATRRIVSGALVITEHLPRTNASDPALLPNHRRRPGAFGAKLVLKRAEARFVDQIITPSTGSRSFMVERYHLEQDKLRVVCNGVAVGAAPTPAVHSGPLEVVCLGSMIAQKGQDVLLAAVHRSSRPWTVTFYGADRANALTEHLSERVTVRAWTPQPRVAMNAASVVCVPSRWEASSYVALEAMSCGRAVVASAVDGLAEIVDDGVTGILVPPDDPTALARALDNLDEHWDECVKMGARGHDRVTRSFTVEGMVAGTLAAYKEAMARRGRSHAR
jgi:glycosyltransferase involved in cell wall biosynthesis